MTAVAVRIDNLGKQYRIGGDRLRGELMLREVVSGLASAPFRKLVQATRRLWSAPTNGYPNRSSPPNHIWALRNVSIEVPRGQILGIIGPNGAGKSTLLKILSRITEPTEGRVEIHGRVASLLEVGTGFHPELTGRENIYLSGALLGMRKAEIDRKLDEIVAFAEIAKFAETPVKRYSSGMFVRLAFAVAAHLEPDVLIIDEVLAVGDVAFQRKCLAKMEAVKQRGRTVLFVSHNMQAVTRLCERTVLVSQGRVQEDGPAAQVARRYLQSGLHARSVVTWEDLRNAPGDEIVRLRSVRVLDEANHTIASLDIRRQVGIEMVYDVFEDGHVLVPAYHIYNESGTCLFVTHDIGRDWRGRMRPRGRFTSVAWLPGNFFAEGLLLVTASISTHRPYKNHVTCRDVVTCHVADSLDGDSARGDWDGYIPGVVRPLLSWTTSLKALSARDETKPDRVP